MKEQELRNNFSSNIAYYRKAMQMTQLDLANALNYSDKAVSKWERGESFPDVYTLTQIAECLGVTPNDLLSERKRIVKHPKDTLAKVIISLLSAGLVWLVATICYVVLSLIFDEPALNLALIFIYAIPASAIIITVFSAIWKNLLFNFISSSTIIWTLALSAYLTINNFIDYKGLWLIFIVCIPVQLLFCLWFSFLYHKKKKAKEARKRFFENNNKNKEDVSK